MYRKCIKIVTNVKFKLAERHSGMVRQRKKRYVSIIEVNKTTKSSRHNQQGIFLLHD